MSVIIQIGSFQTTGKRVFRMSPLQHHFELAGWSEVNIVDPVLDHRRTRRGDRPRPVLRRLPALRAARGSSWCRAPGRWWPAPASPGPRPAPCSALGAAVTVVDRVSVGAGPQAAAGRGRGPRRRATDAPPASGPRRSSRRARRPHHPLVLAARGRSRGVQRARAGLAAARPGRAPWLAVTGTNGKTTTVTMLAAMLRAAGRAHRATGQHRLAAGRRGRRRRRPYDVLAVELSSFQLHWSPSCGRPPARCSTSPTTTWTGTAASTAYAAAKTAIWRRPAGTVAVGNVDDPGVAKRAGRRARVGTVGFTLGAPGRGRSSGWPAASLIDRAFGAPAQSWPRPSDGPPGRRARTTSPTRWPRRRWPGRTAWRRGGPAPGLPAYIPEPHRNALVATVDGVLYVDDSKATNPHAAAASLHRVPAVVWVAGGQLKGVDVDDLVRDGGRPARRGGAARRRPGGDRRRRSRDTRPQSPGGRRVRRTDDGAMAEVVRAAAAAGPRR